MNKLARTAGEDCWQGPLARTAGEMLARTIGKTSGKDHWRGSLARTAVRATGED